MENRRIYLPPIHDMLNRPNVFVEQNDNSYDQYQVINGFETNFTAETAINKANFTGQLFNAPGANSTVSDLPIEQRAAYYHASFHNPPSSPSSVTSTSNPELLQLDIPKYRSTPPHSRSYSDQFLRHDQYPRRLSTSTSPSSTSSVSRSPQLYDYLPQQQQQQQQQHQQQQQTTIRHHHHRRTTSDITPFPHERRKSTQKQHLNSNKSSTSSDEEMLAMQQPSNTHYNRYQCNQCSKTFSRPSSLRIHIFSHTGEKPHECPHPGCGRRFSVQSNMRRHLKVHYCGPQSQQDQNYLGTLPLTQHQQSSGYDVFIAEGSNANSGSSSSGDFYRYSSVSRA